MSEPRNTQEILAEAERAASTGDFLSAETLLRDAAVRQEAELGPVHPDLANTVNNLAVAAEKSGRLDDAETFYRRAVAIASASLQPDDPKLAASRQNLEDFCRAHGRPIERARSIEPRAVEARTVELPADAPSVALPRPALPPPTLPNAPRKTSRAVPLAMGVTGLLVVAALLAWLWWPRHPSTVPTATVPSPTQTDRSPAAGAVVAPDQTPTSTVHRTPPVSSASGAVQLVTVELCLSFSPDVFRCTPAGESVPAGTIVLLTRVRSPRDGVIVHRWFQGDALRKTARLRIGANEAEGYRTYSQQSVDRGNWRVEVRNDAGDLLYERRVTVK
jgi:hypothetical protein